jgi:UDP-N-acetylglucosamine/UDP-N-acetylgalactosamine 4-epimerase
VATIGKHGMNEFDYLQEIEKTPRRWLVTGGAGFIGSNIVEALLRAGQTVVVLDNLSTGYKKNIDAALEGSLASEDKLTFIQGDITSLTDCQNAVAGCDFVLNQAALGSVPRSIKTPIASHQANVDGFLNMLEASRAAGVKRFIYASSSSVYGDSPTLPKVESEIGDPLSPYAATKRINEVYAGVWAKTYGMTLVGLRYFNVFGKRQDPEGAYAAVIPKWAAALLANQSPVVNGDGLTSRDFCFIDNAVQANIRGAISTHLPAGHSVYNVAFGEQTSLNDLLGGICAALKDCGATFSYIAPTYQEFRAGDVRHSLADISAAKLCLRYAPSHSIKQGLSEAMPWYLEQALSVSNSKKVV